MEVLNISSAEQAVIVDLKRFGALIFWFRTIMNNKKMYDITRNNLREYIRNLYLKNIITDTEIVKVYSLARRFGKELVISIINKDD